MRRVELLLGLALVLSDGCGPCAGRRAPATRGQPGAMGKSKRAKASPSPAAAAGKALLCLARAPARRSDTGATDRCPVRAQCSSRRISCCEARQWCRQVSSDLARHLPFCACTRERACARRVRWPRWTLTQKWFAASSCSPVRAESKGLDGFEGGVDGASFAAGNVPKGQVSCACAKMPARVEPY